MVPMLLMARSVLSTWYNIKWDYHFTDSHVRCKIWKTSDAEPSSWDVDFDDGTDSTTRNLFYVELHSNGYDVYGRFGPTDFDYADRPCYYDCADGVTDDFDRTVSAGLGTSTVGLVWVDDSSYGGVTNGLSVDGSAAVFADIYTSGGFSAYTSSGLPIVVGTTADIEFRLRVKWDTIDSTLPVINFGYQWSCVPSTDSSERGWYLGAGSRNDFAFAEDTWYRLHAARISGTLYLSVWLDGDTEPSSWMWSQAGDTTNIDQFYIDHGASTDRYPTVGHMYVDDLSVVGYTNCLPVDPTVTTPGAPTSPSGLGCEAATRSSSTVYTTGLVRAQYDGGLGGRAVPVSRDGL